MFSIYYDDNKYGYRVRVWAMGRVTIPYRRISPSKCPKEKCAVIDLFCGIGGFSEGARRVKRRKWRTRVAIDSWKSALDVHTRNHPNCHHRCMVLGTPQSELYVLRKIKRLKQLGYTKIHLHGSPPCTHFSKSNKKNLMSEYADSKDKNEYKGMELVNWFLNITKCTAITSWSMENVIQCKKFLPESLLQDPNLAIGTLKSSNLGGNTIRNRLYLGKNFNIQTNTNNITPGCVRNCLNPKPEAGDGLVELCDTAWRTNGRCCKFGRLSSLDKPSPTMTCSNNCWKLVVQAPSGGEYAILRKLTMSEYANIHNISNYDQTNMSMRMLGNMVMPECAQAIMENVI